MIVALVMQINKKLGHAWCSLGLQSCVIHNFQSSLFKKNKSDLVQASALVLSLPSQKSSAIALSG